jgi:hypothetical protein
MLRLASLVLAVGASLCFAGSVRGRPAEACLDAPTVVCIGANFAEGADLPLRALPAPARDTPTTWLLAALRALGRDDEAERVSWREQRGAYARDRASGIAVARFLASVRAGAPDRAVLDGLADPASPLAALAPDFDRERLPWSAHRQAGFALLEQFAKEAVVPEARSAPAERQAAFRSSTAWRALDEGLAHWNERVAPVHQPQGWKILAEFRLELGDAPGARDALERAGTAPATLDEIELWWRLGAPDRAGSRARSAGEPRVLGQHLERAARQALALGDPVGALALLDEAWSLGTARHRQRTVDFRHLRRLVRITAEAGDRPLAVARAEAIRDLPSSGTLVPEAHWVDAAAALNDIGAQDAAAGLLGDLLALRPADLAAAGLTAARPTPPAVERPGHSPRVRAAVELYRAGLPAEAARLLHATLPRGSSGPGPGARAAATRALAERANWRLRGMADATIEIAEALRWDAAYPERISGLLALTSVAPPEAQAELLLQAADGDAEHGRTDAALARLAEAIALLSGVDRPYAALCRAMARAALLGRIDLSDTAFGAAVAAARAEPDALRPAILVDAAACRAAPGR